MRYLILIMLATLFIQNAIAQQEQQYSQYLINPFTINPAVASTEDYIDVQMGYRSQWSGLEGAPKTTYVTAYKTIGKPFYHRHYKSEHKSWHGVGIHTFNDKTGPINRNSFLLAYSYNIGLFKNTRLSVGSFLGMKQLKTDAGFWKDIDDNTDILFSQDVSSGIRPELQFGAVMYSEQYFVTLAAHNLIPQNMSLASNGESSSNDYQKHFFMSAGVHLKASEKIKLTPSVFIKYVSTAPLSLDLNLKITHSSNYWYGFSTRYNESVNLFAGLNYNKMFDFTYAFEWSYSKLRSFNSGTHEVILGLRLQHPNVDVDPSKYW